MIRIFRSGISAVAIAVGVLAVFGPAASSFASAKPAPAIFGPKAAAAGSFLTPAVAGQRTAIDALYGVSCVTWTRCVAVGTRVADSSGMLHPLAELWTGRSWRIAGAPDPAKRHRAILASVSCQARTSCVAVGYHYDERGYLLLAERWNGQRWKIIESANPTGEHSAFYNSVACERHVGCLAVGGHSGRTGAGHALAQRWVSGHWQTLKVRTPAGAQATELNGISCYGGSCMAVGEYLASNGQALTLAERWNGKSWILLHSVSARAPMSVLYDVSCTTPHLCMAVGGSQWTKSHALAELWSNGRWRRVAGASVSGGTLNGVSCQTKSWCVAVGTVGSKPLTEAWYGKDWQRTQPPKASGHVTGALSELSCRTGKGRCVTVGARFSPAQPSAQKTLAEWWGGKTWRLMATRNP